MSEKKDDPADGTVKLLQDYWAWTLRNPAVRAPLPLVPAVYASAHVADLIGTTPVVTGTVCASAVAHVAGSRLGGPSLAGVLRTAALGVGGYLSWAAATGPDITDQATLSTYLGMSTAAYLLWLRSNPVAEARRYSSAAQAWRPRAKKWGLEGCRLVSFETTYTGYRYVIDVHGSGMSIMQVARNKQYEMTICAAEKLPIGSVSIQPHKNSARNVEITVRKFDPWRTPVVHPAVSMADKIPVGRSILDDIPIGVDPDTGKTIFLSLYNEHGGEHTTVVAKTGGGKTNILNGIAEYISGCPDAQLLFIDVIKGKDSRVWEPLTYRTITSKEGRREALAALREMVELIRTRAAKSATAVHQPTPEEPAFVLVLDEVSSTIGDDEMSADFVSAIGEIFRTGRSEGVVIIAVSQRAVLEHLGTGDAKMNSAMLCLRVKNAAEMRNAFGEDWAEEGIPDMSKIQPGVKGVFAYKDGDGAVSSGRAYLFSDLDTIRKIVSTRASILEPRERDELVVEEVPNVEDEFHEANVELRKLEDETPEFTIPSTAPAAVPGGFIEIIDELFRTREGIRVSDILDFEDVPWGRTAIVGFLGELVASKRLVREGAGPTTRYRRHSV